MVEIKKNMVMHHSFAVLSHTRLGITAVTGLKCSNFEQCSGSEWF